MTTKTMAAGDLFTYLLGDQDYKAQPREQAPELVRGPGQSAEQRLQLAQQRLRLLELPHVTEDPRRRRVGHCRRHLTHLISGFAEGFRETAPHIPRVTAATEHLVLAGLRPEALEFSWIWHAQETMAHLHGGMVRALLPAGGPYEPELDFELSRRFDFLASLKLELSDPIKPDPERNLIYGGRFSNKGPLRQLVAHILTATREACLKQKKLATRPQFFTFLEKDLGWEIVAAPNESGQLKWRTPQPLGRDHNLLAVRKAGSAELIWLGGAICRAGFQYKTWAAKMARRSQEYKQKWLAQPHHIFQEFGKLLQRRGHQQQRRYGVSPTTPGLIGMKEFAWLNPANLARPVGAPLPLSVNVYVPDAASDELARFSPEIMTPLHFADGAGEEVLGSEPQGMAEWPPEAPQWWLPEGHWERVTLPGTTTIPPVLPPQLETVVPSPGPVIAMEPPLSAPVPATGPEMGGPGNGPDPTAKPIAGPRPTVRWLGRSIISLRQRRRVHYPQALRVGLILSSELERARPAPGPKKEANPSPPTKKPASPETPSARPPTLS